MKTVYVLQPGKLGDLIITTPIIKFYKNYNYKIKWFVFDNFINFFNSIEDVEIIAFNRELNNNLYISDKRLNFSDDKSLQACFYIFNDVKEYIKNNLKKEDIFLDISWGFPGSNQFNLSLIREFHEQKRNWIDMKYFLSGVPLEYRWKFSWKRDEIKEDTLLKYIKNLSYKKYGTEKFNLVHNYSNNKKSISIENQIDFKYITGYEIYDWYKVLLESNNIYCVDSCLCNFVEVLPELKTKTKYYLGSEEPHYFEYMRNILLNNWLDHEGNRVISDYEGKL